MGHGRVMAAHVSGDLRCGGDDPFRECLLLRPPAWRFLVCLDGKACRLDELAVVGFRRFQQGVGVERVGERPALRIIAGRVAEPFPVGEGEPAARAQDPGDFAGGGGLVRERMAARPG